jgi:putative membrane protein
VKLFLQRWAINTVAVLVASFVPGVHFQEWHHLVLASLLLGVLNTILRPLLLLVSIPLLILTLGFFFLIINAALLSLVGWLLQPGFSVDGFWAALFGGIVISVVSTVLGFLTGTSETKVRVQRGAAPNPGPASDHRRLDRDDDDKGNGPVIDV